MDAANTNTNTNMDNDNHNHRWEFDMLSVTQQVAAIHEWTVYNKHLFGVEFTRQKRFLTPETVAEMQRMAIAEFVAAVDAAASVAADPTKGGDACSMLAKVIGDIRDNCRGVDPRAPMWTPGEDPSTAGFRPDIVVWYNAKLHASSLVKE